MKKGVRTKVNMLGVKMDKHCSVRALEDSESMQEAKKSSTGRGRGTRYVAVDHLYLYKVLLMS